MGRSNDRGRLERIGRDAEAQEELRRADPELAALLDGGAVDLYRDPNPPTRRQRRATAALVLTAMLAVGGVGLGGVEAWWPTWDFPGGEGDTTPSVCTDPPNTPTLVVAGLDTSADMDGSAFASPCPGDVHDSSTWWITVQGSPDTVWLVTSADSLIRYNGAGATVPLAPDSTGHVGFLVYYGQAGGASGFALDSFWTDCATPANTPTVTATPTDTSATLNGSAYSGCELHVSSSWWITLVSNGDTVWSDFNSDSLVRWTDAGASVPLDTDTAYVAHVIYEGATLPSGEAVDTFVAQTGAAVFYVAIDWADSTGTDAYATLDSGGSTPMDGFFIGGGASNTFAVEAAPAGWPSGMANVLALYETSAAQAELWCGTTSVNSSSFNCNKSSPPGGFIPRIGPGDSLGMRVYWQTPFPDSIADDPLLHGFEVLDPGNNPLGMNQVIGQGTLPDSTWQIQLDLSNMDSAGVAAGGLFGLRGASGWGYELYGDSVYRLDVLIFRGVDVDSVQYNVRARLQTVAGTMVIDDDEWENIFNASILMHNQWFTWDANGPAGYRSWRLGINGFAGAADGFLFDRWGGWAFCDGWCPAYTPGEIRP